MITSLSTTKGANKKFIHTEHTTAEVYFEIKGATNLDDLSNPLVEDDIVYAKYDGSQWNCIQTLYQAGIGSINYGKVNRVDVDHIGFYGVILYIFDATLWESPSDQSARDRFVSGGEGQVTMYNVADSDLASGSVIGDEVMCWQMYDDEANLRWFCTPVKYARVHA